MVPGALYVKGLFECLKHIHLPPDFERYSLFIEVVLILVLIGEACLNLIRNKQNARQKINTDFLQTKLIRTLEIVDKLTKTKVH